jgi:hypothetical protein
MAKGFKVVANFPTQKADLVEIVQGTSWTVALGRAARAMRKRLKGSRVRVASFVLEQVEVAESVAAEGAVAQQAAQQVLQPAPEAAIAVGAAAAPIVDPASSGE